MTDDLITETTGHILKITLNRPDKSNALNWNIIRGIGAAYTELSDNPALRCGVLCANGRNFTGGLDLMDMAPRMANNDFEDEGLANPFRLDRDGAELRECTKPVVVAIHGRCYTAGIELALAADIIVAAKDTIFAQSEVRRGIYPMGGATFRMPERFGWHNAMRYLLTGDDFDATEAHRLGLVQEITEPGEHLDRAMEIAERIAKNAPLGVQATIANARLAEKEGPLAAARALLPNFQKVAASADAQEGMMSMMQKREPEFKGE
ncbi:MAG: enoyl-CoA hydratase [Hyphococcus sp.]|nr:MAG: enoyl-CoA hydratase [Marinicaulis sp.]